MISGQLLMFGRLLHFLCGPLVIQRIGKKVSLTDMNSLISLLHLVHLSFWGWSSRMRFQCGTESVLQQLHKGQCRHREHSANTVLTHSQRGQTLQKYSTKMCKVHLKV